MYKDTIFTVFCAVNLFGSVMMFNDFELDKFSMFYEGCGGVLGFNNIRPVRSL